MYGAVDVQVPSKTSDPSANSQIWRAARVSLRHCLSSVEGVIYHEAYIPDVHFRVPFGTENNLGGAQHLRLNPFC